MENCQVDDASSLNDQISHGFASSLEFKTSMQLQGDVGISTISTEKNQTSNLSRISSDLSSETGQESNEDRKAPVADKRPTRSLNENLVENSHFEQDRNGYVHATSSYKSKNVHKSEVVVSSGHYPQKCKIDLSEDIKTAGREFLQQSRHKSTYSGHSVNVLEPIIAVAKVGVPVGKPEKPLQFGGELGWRRSGTASAFRPAFHGNSERRNKVGDNSEICCSRQSLFSQGIDLNVAPMMEIDLLTDDPAMDVSSNLPQGCPLDLNSESGNDVNHHKLGNHVIQNTYKTTNQQLSENCVAIDTPTCPTGSERKPVFEGRRSLYCVGSNSMRGFDHGQAQPLFVAMPPTDQVQMVVPIQSGVSFFPHAPSGVYVNSLPPAFHPSFVSHFNGHHGPVLASYPGTLNAIESSQGVNPNTLTNIRPTLIQNRNIAFLENRSRGARNIEQLALPAFSSKRREPDGGWDSSPISFRRLAP